MAVVSTAPSKFAQRLIERDSLSPPIDVRSLLERYAEVIDASIPISGIDGVCLDLKVPGKPTRVIINSENPPLRRRFTEAHELGHVIIPWHRGTIVDHLNPDRIEEKDEYWTFEEEANQFAAELLMPSAWLDRLLASTSDLSVCHAHICHECQVSAHAAYIRMSALLPPHIVFIAEKGGKVEFSGRTLGTLASTPPWGDTFDANAYRYATHHYVTSQGARRLHWWQLPDRVEATAISPRPWRDILDTIVADIGIPDDDRKTFKMSVNGILSAANGAMKRRSMHTKDAVIAACLQRFSDRSDLTAFVDHPDFMDFVIKRAEELTADSGATGHSLQ
ncbi:ImmA/IrrE family metallo-endopeptidase [Vogesella sp. LIG4]|uniref:ImmA/IrrE family metallo-endopeptidase n=1 Tax=Vogesella sp. LIG4 TaxID=1192162 RepID=UPI00081F7572|nr:ImmA/IrrE family metallo-endopeptidase [Vogesella sp. LIG4]SCK09016.1 Predicted Zn peptidase [Vogesella sp. LIG4]